MLHLYVMCVFKGRVIGGHCRGLIYQAGTTLLDKKKECKVRKTILISLFSTYSLKIDKRWWQVDIRRIDTLRLQCKKNVRNIVEIQI